MIRHVVAFALTEEDPQLRAAQAEDAASRLNALLGVVPTLRTMTAGANVLFPDGNWDLVLVADFDDEEGLDAYQVHPAHQEFGAFLAPLRKDRVAVDFLI